MTEMRKDKRPGAPEVISQPGRDIELGPFLLKPHGAANLACALFTAARNAVSSEALQDEPEQSVRQPYPLKRIETVPATQLHQAQALLKEAREVLDELNAPETNPEWELDRELLARVDAFLDKGGSK